VNQNRQINVNWFNINVPTILAVVGAAIGIIKYIDDVDDRSARTEIAMAEMKGQIEPLTAIPFRVLNNEGAIAQLSRRVDQISETVINAVEAIRNDISGLSTKVEVQSTKIDNLTDKVDRMDSKPKPTGFRQ